jgi:pentatricopeptide repeat protein
MALYDTKWNEIMGPNDAKIAQLKDYAHGTIGTT